MQKRAFSYFHFADGTCFWRQHSQKANGIVNVNEIAFVTPAFKPGSRPATTDQFWSCENDNQSDRRLSSDCRVVGPSCNGRGLGGFPLAHQALKGRRTTAAGPSTSRCATGSGGASGSRSGAQPAPRWRDLDTPSQFQRPRRSQRARLTPVTLAASARPTSNVPPLRDHERPPRAASFGRMYDAAVAPASP